MKAHIWVLVWVVAVVMVGCEGGSEDSGDGTVSGGDGTTSGSTSGNDTAGSDTSGGGGDGCQVPAGATVLASFRRYSQEDVNYPAYSVGSDGTLVYVAFYDQVVSVPQSGGEPTVVYAGQNALGLGMYDFGGSAFLIKDGQDWLDLANGTTSAAVFPEALDPVSGLPVPLSMIAAKDADTVWGRFDNLSERTASYFVLERGETTARTVVEGVAEGYAGGTLVVSADFDHALTIRVPEAQGWTDWADFFLIAEAGGAPTLLSVDRPGRPFLMTPESIYYNRAEDAPLEELGVWRAPRVGGAGVKLGGTFGGFWGVREGNRVAFHNTSALWTISDDPADTSLVKVLDLPVRSTIDASCTSHGLALRNGEVISTMYSQKTRETLIFKIALP